MGAIGWYLQAWRRYADFDGRSARTEYWCFVLGNAVVATALAILDVLLGGSLLGRLLVAGDLLYSLAVLVPGLAVTVRRLHDTGRSGFWILIALVPVVGWLMLLVFMLEPSQRGANQYGR